MSRTFLIKSESSNAHHFKSFFESSLVGANLKGNRGFHFSYPSYEIISMVISLVINEVELQIF